jgi:hypothetical protein
VNGEFLVFPVASFVDGPSAFQLSSHSLLAILWRRISAFQCSFFSGSGFLANNFPSSLLGQGARLLRQQENKFTGLLGTLDSLRPACENNLNCAVCASACVRQLRACSTPCFHRLHQLLQVLVGIPLFQKGIISQHFKGHLGIEPRLLLVLHGPVYPRQRVVLVGKRLYQMFLGEQVDNLFDCIDRTVRLAASEILNRLLFERVDVGSIFVGLGDLVGTGGAEVAGAGKSPPLNSCLALVMGQAEGEVYE